MPISNKSQNITNYEYNHTDFDFESLPKLVRDNIPTIIHEKHGTLPETLILNDDGFEKYLKRKLVEESLEALNTEKTEDLTLEIADIYEVLDSLIEFKKIDKKKILETQTQKRNKNGGFKQKILLISK
jgi:predicted house-cleaning noncanonical NTP pyrophosphatase (MazG superfamily)